VNLLELSAEVTAALLVSVPIVNLSEALRVLDLCQLLSLLVVEVLDVVFS